MKTLIIESCPTITRWSIENGETPQLQQSYRLWGHRQSKHGKWLWTDGCERLSAFEDETISVGSLWKSLLDPKNKDRHEDAISLVTAVFSDIKIKEHLDRIVFIIPESLPETSQNALITALSLRCRVLQRETYLLWRSVALALTESTREHDESSRTILDFGHFFSEFSTLKLTYSQGYRCPVRDFTGNRVKGLQHYDALNAWIHNNYTCPRDTTAFALENFHANTYKHLQNDLNFDPPAAWEYINGRYEERTVSHDEFAKPVPLERSTENVECFIDETLVKTNGKILWHGWPAYWHGEHAIQQHHQSSLLTEPDAMLRGGIEFAKRHRLGRPIYFELIPGYGIWCQVAELGLPKEWRWEELIPKDEISGTETFKAKPIDRFQLNPGTLSFNMNIRLGKSTMYRFVEQTLPVKITNDTPIVINSEIRPTGGGVKFSLRAKDDPDLFGQNAEVSLRWDIAEQKLVSELQPPEQKETTYPHPFIILSEGDSDKRTLLNPAASNISKGGNVSDQLTLLYKTIPPVMRVNQFVIPFGNRAITEGLTKEMLQLIDAINSEAEWHIQNVSGRVASSWKWTRIAGALFNYASEENQNLLFDQVMRSDFPLSDFKNSSLFWSFGRVCRDPQQLESYLNRAVAEWENLAGMHYWLFWPFQKSLCCYGKSAQISRKTAYSVFECASEMLEWIIQDDVPTQTGAFGESNWKKWTLSAILFGLRVRELHTDFLSLDSGPRKERHLAVKLREQLMKPEILTTPIPPLALAGINVGPNPPTLSELVLRFLEARANDADIKLAGGIGLSS